MMLLLLALVRVGWLAAENSGTLAADTSQRAGTQEFALPVRYIDGQTLDFDHGTSVQIDSDLGWGFGFRYNFSVNMNLNLEFAWMSAN